MSRRSEQLKAVANDFILVHEAWVEDDNRPNPDESYWDAVDALRETFEHGEIPAESRVLADAVEDFLDEASRFDAREDVNNFYPGDAFWEARERIAKVLEGDGVNPAELRPLESIKELVSQGVTHMQIAKMYGFFNRNGDPMPHLVQRELDKPGSVLETKGAVDGKDWIDPRLKEQQEAAEAAARHTGRLADKTKKAAVEHEPACPESPRDLWEQNVSPKQAAKMLRKPLAEVEGLWAQFDQEREDRLAGDEDGADGGEAATSTVDENTAMIYGLADEGMEAAKIAAEMKMSRRAVEKVLGQRQKAGV